MKIELRLIVGVLVIAAILVGCQPADTPTAASPMVVSESTDTPPLVKNLTPEPAGDPQVTPTSTPEADPREELGKPTWRSGCLYCE